MYKNLIFITYCLINSNVWGLTEYTDTKYDRPIREIAVIASDEGYYPKQISVFEGERVRFFVSSISSGPNCLVIAKHELFLAANRGRITEGEAIFMEPGRVEYYCPASKIRGAITVLRNKRPKPTRTVAGKKTGPWMPKEF
jgi:hypothetical protein